MPLNDPRVSVETCDVVTLIRGKKRAWDAILLDIDNGPSGLTQEVNNRLYAEQGLRAAFSALIPGGVLGIWSAGDDPAFTRRLGKCGFQAKVTAVRAASSERGAGILSGLPLKANRPYPFLQVEIPRS